MSQPRRAPNSLAAYLKGSPISQLFTWATKSSLDHKDSSRADSSSRHVEKDSRHRDVVDEEASMTLGSDAIKTEPGEEYPVEVEAQCDTKEASQHERHNAAHDWSLGRRIVVAGVICLYT
jgi:hypothetical protein